MTVLTDIFPWDDFQLAAHDGLIRQQKHPVQPLAILNYTEKAQYDKVWNRVTRACRGLIYNTATLDVLARPFPKFFNLSEHDDADISAMTGKPCEVWEKVDGSLGILYRDDNGWAVATRGSFLSDQAVHATRLLTARYPTYQPPLGVTVLFEVVYPNNRIVVDYHGLDDLVLLGGVDMATGHTVWFDEVARTWPGPVARRMPHNNLSDALTAPEQPNTEGYVIRFVGSDMRVKCKTTEYVRLHRLVTGVTARIIWQYMGIFDLAAQGQDTRRIAQTLNMEQAKVGNILAATPDGNWVKPFLEAVPEEFSTWVHSTMATLYGAVEAWETAARQEYVGLCVEQLDRSAAASIITTLPREQQGPMFALFGGSSIRPMAWRAIRPAHELPFATTSPDVA
jgi:RNA ligase